MIHVICLNILKHGFTREIKHPFEVFLASRHLYGILDIPFRSSTFNLWLATCLLAEVWSVPASPGPLTWQRDPATALATHQVHGGTSQLGAQPRMRRTFRVQEQTRISGCMCLQQQVTPCPADREDQTYSNRNLCGSLHKFCGSLHSPLCWMAGAEETSSFGVAARRQHPGRSEGQHRRQPEEGQRMPQPLAPSGPG